MGKLLGSSLGILVTIVALSMAAFGTVEVQAQDRLAVYVVNYPLKYFAERIGGSLVQVVLPAPAEVDPAFWKPDVATTLAYQEADLILLNGAEYAAWVEVVSLPASKLVNTSAAFVDHFMTMEGAATHSHGPEGEHDHGPTAFTTWLDPRLALQQAEAIYEALVKRRPSHQKELGQQFEALKADLLALDGKLASIVARTSSRPLLVSHPVYQYLTRRYDLNVRAVHWEPDEIPEPARWNDLTRLLDDHRAQWMLWEAEPLASSVARLEELGVQSAVFAPCGNAPAEGDYLEVMQQNAARLARVFE